MNDDKRILLYFRDANLASLLTEYMHTRGMPVVSLDYSENIIAALQNDNYDVLIMESDSSASSRLCDLYAVRLVANMLPVILVASSDTSSAAAVDAYKYGADLVLRRPFSLDELWHRLQVCFRYSDTTATPDISAATQYTIGELEFDPMKRTLVNAEGQIVTRVTPKESSMLRLLCSHKGRIVSRALLMRTVWPHKKLTNTLVLDVYMTRLRRLLSVQKGVSIVNIRSMGYRLLTK